jgi:predicted small metal-binding protein
MPLDEGGSMAKVVNCECGYTVRGEDDDEIVANVEEHVRQAHPEMAGQMSREQVLAMAEEA